MGDTPEFKDASHPVRPPTLASAGGASGRSRNSQANRADS